MRFMQKGDLRQILSGLFKAGLFKLRMKISIFRAFIKVHRGVYEIANTLLAGRKNAEAVRMRE